MDSVSMEVAGETFTITLADTDSAKAFKEMLPLTLDMTELNGNERYASLGKSLPTDDVRPGTISTGDVMLYQGNTLVVFYKTFSSPYSYSWIGTIIDPDGLVEALGSSESKITFRPKA